MAAQVPSHQVFISYAHADNQSFDEDTRGWVTNFIDHLKIAALSGIGMVPERNGHFRRTGRRW
ncbi:hypothetical protein CCP3SC15_1470007 [Gammaproteobacteria bacterium]